MMKIHIPFRLLLLVKLIITLSLLGILSPFPHLLAAQSLSEARATDSNTLTSTAAREIGRDANGHWHLIFKKRQEPKDGIWMARTTNGKPAGVGSTRVLLITRTKQACPRTKLNGTSRPVKRSRSLLRRRVGTEYASQNWWRPDSIARVNPKKLQLFVDGQEQAIRVVGQDDKRFDAQDFIEFYATGPDTPFTDTRTYYLLEGKSAGEADKKIQRQRRRRWAQRASHFR